MDNWEYLYYYAMGLYHLHDTTNARLHLQKAVGLMEKDGDRGRKVLRKLVLWSMVCFVTISRVSADNQVDFEVYISHH